LVFSQFFFFFSERKISKSNKDEMDSSHVGC
jgi:hypothetical protein